MAAMIPSEAVKELFGNGCQPVGFGGPWRGKPIDVERVMR